MAEISYGGLWLRWSSLTPVDKRDFVLSMVLASLSGMLVGLHGPGLSPSEPAPIWFALSPLPPGLLSAWLYYRLVRRQDELFRTVNRMGLWGGLLAMLAVILPAGLLERAGAMEAPFAWWGILAFVVGALVGTCFGAWKYVGWKTD
ncbi:hypothetical protein [Oleisolibacter albus]|uniref:hypothetical protein n=1 Tax=Oleisolibacter albus TaxID=2171757 RepID=UPI000DF157B7|nr:hypothetical protein [Oleisolibacter albus]